MGRNVKVTFTSESTSVPRFRVMVFVTPPETLPRFMFSPSVAVFPSMARETDASLSFTVMGTLKSLPSRYFSLTGSMYVP